MSNQSLRLADYKRIERMFVPIPVTRKGSYEWIIETGGKRWKCRGDTIGDAFRRAWKDHPPERVGELSRFSRTTSTIGLRLLHPRWKYVDTIVALSMAGYGVTL